MTAPGVEYWTTAMAGLVVWMSMGLAVGWAKLTLARSRRRR